MAQVAPVVAARPAVASQEAMLAENAALRAQLRRQPLARHAPRGAAARAGGLAVGLGREPRRCVRASGATGRAAARGAARPPEFLLACEDPAEMADRSLEWLAEHAGVREGHCLVLDPDRDRLVRVAGHGVERVAVNGFGSTWRTTITRWSRRCIGRRGPWSSPGVRGHASCPGGAPRSWPCRSTAWSSRTQARAACSWSARCRRTATELEWVAEYLGYRLVRARLRATASRPSGASAGSGTSCRASSTR